MALNSCCFCIPLRTGVTAIAVISTLFYIGILIWITRGHNAVYAFPQEDLTTALAVYWTTVAVVGVYAMTSIVGVIGGIMQNRNMINIFRFLYWTVTVILLLSSTILWIIMMVKQSTIVSGCQQYLTELATQSGTSYYAPVVVPGGGAASNFYQEDCASATKQFLIISGIVVFVGNFVQIYFASTISAYARRLKATSGGRTAQHHKLRDMDDFPDTSKMAVY